MSADLAAYESAGRPFEIVIVSRLHSSLDFEMIGIDRQPLGSRCFTSWQFVPVSMSAFIPTGDGRSGLRHRGADIVIFVQ